MQNITAELEAGREFFSVSDVAIKFGISRKSVYRLIERRLLSSSTALRRKMIPRVSIDAFITASQQGGER
jgi:predicted DNA-binding transcriptional regulator AlpA